jgi:uncharacterized protein YrrD
MKGKIMQVNTMEFKEGTAVYSSDNEQVGHIDRVVLDPNTKTVTHVVVRQGFLFTEDKVVPIGLISKATEDRVTLRHPADQLELPEFEETHYLPGNYYNEDRSAMPRPVGYAYPLFAYPPLGTAWWGYPGYRGYPFTAPNIETERNIPDSTVPLKEGSAVIADDGERVGTIERIFTDPSSKRATHILISRGWLFTTEKLIPTSWIERMVEDQVRLSVGSEALERLPDYQD